MYVVWQRMERKSSGGGQLFGWLFVHLSFPLDEHPLFNPLKHRVGWFVDHAFSMAPRRSVWGEWWTLAQVSQLMEHLRFTYKNAVNLSGFVTLTLAEFVTPQQVRHGLVVDSEGNVLKFNLGSHE